MSSTLADLSRLEDLLYDEYGNSKFRPDIKWKATNKHKDTYEAYEIPTDFEDWFRGFDCIEHA